ncbi:MAG: MGMT family protein [Planctomycetota bacterium]
MQPDETEERVTGPGFHERVYDAVRRIPAGRVSTYGDVARALGSVRVARHVGWALAAPTDAEVPWHRVVKSDGKVAFPRDDDRGRRQRVALCEEGVEVRDNGRVERFNALRVEPELLR